MNAMPPNVMDGSGQIVRLGSRLGQGGEGAVYEVLSQTDLVAKIYHQPLSRERADKIQAMTKLRSEILASLTAWPLGLVSTKASNAPIGLLMPRISGRKDIHRLYSPKSRRTDFQRADWRFLLRAAANTARAFAAVHDAGCVIGDVNHGGVLVAQDATVRLIDCDSFQVTYGGRRFLCEVGVETFTPPELQGRSFDGVVRTENHDNFGLAVMVFLLLFMGRHPFAGRFSGQGDMPISRAIAEFRFPYGSRHVQAQMTRPPGTPPLTVVGPAMAAMFERAFARETATAGRPAAREWMAALGALEKELKQCSANPAHWHPGNISCPWCPMEGTTGVSLFPLIMQAAVGSGFDIDRLWRQVEALQHPGAAPHIAPAAIMPSADASALATASRKRNVVASVVAAGFIIAALAGGGFVFFLLGLAAFFGIRAAMDKSKELAALRSVCDSARADWDRADREWRERSGPESFDAKKRELERLRQEWSNIPSLRLRKLDDLKRNLKVTQLNRFLDSFHIRNAKIEGVGSGRKQTLASFGIETCADVTEAALKGVPGFGPKTQRRMLDWRLSIENRFVFNPNQGVDQQDLAKLERDIISTRQQIETKLTRAFAELQQTRAQIMAAREHLRPQIEKVAARYAQALADYNAVKRI